MAPNSYEYMEESMADDGRREVTIPVPQQILSISEMLSENDLRRRWTNLEDDGVSAEQLGSRDLERCRSVLPLWDPRTSTAAGVGYIWQ
jgi:hypothetical protein